MIWILIAVSTVVCFTGAALFVMWRKKHEAYIYVPEGTVLSSADYRKLPLTECKWCGSRLNGNRHHIVPWSAAPELKDDPSNIVCLCRDDHFRVAHGGNWKRFNAGLREALAAVKWVDSNEYYKETHNGKERTETRK